MPYSNRPDAALLVLSDGRWIPGVRVESASFSLSISALLNAVTTAFAAGRTDVSAVLLSRPFLPEEHLAMQYPPLDMLAQVGPDSYSAADRPFPVLRTEWDPRQGGDAPLGPEAGIRLARSAARNAYVPESDFPVGCVLETAAGFLISGVNIEHRDWSRVLCAERNVLGTAVSYGFEDAQTLYLSCLRDPSGTPCGACRQLISELAPRSTLWMDRGEQPAEQSHPRTLLPGSFTGSSIPKKP